MFMYSADELRGAVETTSRCPGRLGRLFLAFICGNRPANDYDDNIVGFPHTSQ